MAIFLYKNTLLLFFGTFKGAKKPQQPQDKRHVGVFHSPSPGSGIGESELIREGLLEEAELALPLKHENEEQKASADPGTGERLMKRS